jgi:hypothetical protein
MALASVGLSFEACAFGLLVPSFPQRLAFGRNDYMLKLLPQLLCRVSEKLRFFGEHFKKLPQL